MNRERMTKYLATRSLTVDPREHLTGPDFKLAIEAFGLLESKLNEYGSELNNAHREALEKILVRMTALAGRACSGRYPYDLDTGMGKSLAVACWIAGVFKTKRPFSIVVGAGQVEGLCAMKRQLISLGVPGEKIGLWHSKNYSEARAKSAEEGLERDYASEPSDGPDVIKDRQFALVTHERIRNLDALPQYNTFQGRDRDLVVWDESFVSSDAEVVQVRAVNRALGWLTADSRNNRGEKGQVLSWLKQVVKDAKRSMKGQRGDEPKAISLPPLPEGLTALDAESILSVLAYSKGAPREDIQHCCQLAKMTHGGRKVRVSRLHLATAGGQRETSELFISYAVTVPDALERILILDASYNIHALEKLDAELAANKDDSFNGRIKSYHQAKLKVWYTSSGKHSLAAKFGDESAATSDEMQEMMRVAKSIPKGEALAFFVHKEHDVNGRKINGRAVLRAALKAAGLRPDETIETPSGRKPRFPILTWGQADTATNHYSYVKHMMFVSVLHLNKDTIYSCAVAQQRDLEAPEIGEQRLNEMSLDMATHYLYQAMNRGTARVVKDGVAGEAVFYLRVGHPRIVANLCEMMPGLQVDDWVEGSSINNNGQGKADKLAKLVAGYLKTLEPHQVTVSVRKVLTQVGAKRVPHMTKQRALNQALEQMPNWRRDDRTLRRERTAEEFGFTEEHGFRVRSDSGTSTEELGFRVRTTEALGIRGRTKAA